MTALELIHAGEAKFYSYVQQSTFIPLLKELDARGVSYTLEDIYNIFRNPKLMEELTGEEISGNHMKGLTAALTAYADLAQINSAAPEINLAEIMQAGDVCYFDLRSAYAPEVSAALGKMIAMDLQTLAAGRTQMDRLAVIAIDEFQNMACQAFKNIISKVRSANYGLILANQAMSDLRAVSQDFFNTVMTNSATKIVFIVEDPADAMFFARRGGNILHETTSHSHSNSVHIIPSLRPRETVSESISELETYLIHPNVISQLPVGKSVIFRRSEMATLGNHAHMIPKAEERSAGANAAAGAGVGIMSSSNVNGQ